MHIVASSAERTLRIARLRVQERRLLIRMVAFCASDEASCGELDCAIRAKPSPARACLELAQLRLLLAH
jgi:hypothetical protein